MIGFRGDRVWGFLFRLHESGIGFVGRNLGIAVLVLSRLGSCIPPFSVCSRGLFVPRVGHECLHGVYIEPKRLCRLGTFGAQGILVESSHCGQEAKTLNPKTLNQLRTALHRKTRGPRKRELSMNPLTET